MRKKFTCDKNTSLEDLLELLRGLEVRPLLTAVTDQLCKCHSTETKHDRYLLRSWSSDFRHLLPAWARHFLISHIISEHLFIGSHFCFIPVMSVQISTFLFQCVFNWIFLSCFNKLQNCYSLQFFFLLLICFFIISRGRRRRLWKTRGTFIIWSPAPRTLWGWNPETLKRRAAAPSSSKPCVTSNKTRSVFWSSRQCHTTTDSYIYTQVV